MLEMMTKRDSKYYRKIGKIGGVARVRKYGNPGTKEGRSRGGKNAILRMRKMYKNGNDTDFLFAKKLEPIHKSTILAEFIGVLFGDGHVGRYQTSITLDSKTDRAYAEYLKTLIEDHFGASAALRFRKNKRAIDLTVSSVLFCKQMVRFGMVEGNKIQNGLRVPEWIKASRLYTKAFLRGLFDTDGSVYIERKRTAGKVYCYVGAAFYSASPLFLEDIVKSLCLLGFSPTYTRRQRAVFLRRQHEVGLYFSMVTSHNPKHSVRYQLFIKER